MTTSKEKKQSGIEQGVGITPAVAEWINENPGDDLAENIKSLLRIQLSSPDANGMAILREAVAEVKGLIP